MALRTQFQLSAHATAFLNATSTASTQKPCQRYNGRRSGFVIGFTIPVIASLG